MARKKPLYDYVDCRAIGHSWQSFHVEKKPSFGYAVDLLCARCSTHRRDILSITGNVIARVYTYPENYKMKGVTKTEWREAWLRNLAKTTRKARNA